MKQFLANHLKNIPGWKTKRRLLAFAVDDYGNVRLASPKAKQNLQASGIKLIGRFDHFDALDTREDYEMLFDVLGSVKDKKGNPAIFTPYALPCNINFEKSIKERRYVPETLEETYSRMSMVDKVAYNGALDMIREGVKNKFIKPQFHGREHINLLIINKLFEENDSSLSSNLDNYSMAGLNGSSYYPGVSFSQAFAFNNVSETMQHDCILKDGLNKFREVYGYDSLTFTPPSQEFFTKKYDFLESLGVKGIHKGLKLLRKDDKGNGFYEKSKLGIKKGQNHVSIVRNVVFEPTEQRGVDWVDFTFKQIQAAFFWNKPAIVSSHRVNFCGHIDPKNRVVGLLALKQLLQKVTCYYPDVEFVSIDEITKDIIHDYGYSYLQD